MKALTVQQPWAWAIIHGGKTIENRTEAWSYRGPLAIHAGLQWSETGGASRNVARAFAEVATGALAEMPSEFLLDVINDVICENGGIKPWPEIFDVGVVLGTVDLVDVHQCRGTWQGDRRGPRCCESPWAEFSWELDRTTTPVSRHALTTHLVLANPRPIVPIACRGQLGLWNTPDHVTAWIEDQLRSAS